MSTALSRLSEVDYGFVIVVLLTVVLSFVLRDIASETFKASPLDGAGSRYGLRPYRGSNADHLLPSIKARDFAVTLQFHSVGDRFHQLGTHGEFRTQRASRKRNPDVPRNEMFPVGAAFLTADGKTSKGANVENVSYGGTICAERTAIVKAVVNPSVAGSTFNNQVSIQNEGIKSFVALAVTSNLPAAILSCGDT
ncbi:hypothetical protein BDZ89DRAFT_1132545 [Hymenopellis radicata]|nr:hypothetical protein BDZ89DRAFT_1132545 [Hymenopellis radicata]